jgi:hypothetical protein
MKLVELIETLNMRGIRFQSLTEAIDTTTFSGVFVFHMMAAMAQFERTHCGMTAARDRDRRVRRQASKTSAQCVEALALSPTVSVAQLAEPFNVHPRAVQHVQRNRPCRPRHRNPAAGSNSVTPADAL